MKVHRFDIVDGVVICKMLSIHSRQLLELCFYMPYFWEL
jgi:hypothetical protein